MLFRLALDNCAEKENSHTPEVADDIIPVIYRLEVVTTAKCNGNCYSYELDGELAEKRDAGVIKDTFHRSPQDPFSSSHGPLKVDAILLYEVGPQE